MYEVIIIEKDAEPSGMYPNNVGRFEFKSYSKAMMFLMNQRMEYYSKKLQGKYAYIAKSFA